MKPDITIAEIAARLEIPQLWRVLNLPGIPGKCVCSPFRKDTKPSFSIYQEGGRWRFRDHATGDRGDSLDFVAAAKGCDAREALSWAKALLGIEEGKQEAGIRDNNAKRRWMPPLNPGTASELQQLAELRGFSMEGLRLAESRGFLGFTSFAGSPCWAVRDLRGQLMELRRLDGQLFEAYKSLPERKSHCIGNGKSFPLGIQEAEDFQTIAWFEGAADFVAAFTFLVAEGKADSVTPLGMLGAANHKIASDALAKLSGKRVVIYPHCDEAGQLAATEWARQLRDAGADVAAFDLSGCVKCDGSSGKDLADVCMIAPDSFESDPKWLEVMP